MKLRALSTAILAAACLSGAAAGQERDAKEKPVEEACQTAAQRYRSADESLRKAKEASAPAKAIEKRTKDLERSRREYCDCLARARAKSDAPAPAEIEELCNPKTTLPTQGTDGDKAAPSATPGPKPTPSGDACADPASVYEKTWMRYSENTGSKALQGQLQSAKSRLCGCLVKNYAYEGVLPQTLRAFCEDRAILTPPYFPSRGETPGPGTATALQPRAP